MKEKLMRHKHLVLILLLLSAPVGAEIESFYHTLRTPLDVMFHFNGRHFESILYLFLFQLVFCSWIFIQKKAILGEPYSHYCYSLPLTKKALYKIDLILLLAAINVLWLPFIFEFMFLSLQPIHANERISNLLVILLLLLLNVEASYSFIRNKIKQALLLSLINIPIGFILSLNETTNRITFLSILMTILLMLTYLNTTESKYLFSSLTKTKKNIKKNTSYKPSWLPNLQLNYIILMREYRVNLMFRLFACLMIILLFNRIRIQSDHLPNVMQFQLVTGCIFALIMSGLSSLLHESYLEHQRYFLSLPGVMHAISIASYVTVLTLILVMLSINVMIGAIYSLPVTPFIFLTTVMVMPLCWILHCTQRRYIRFGTFISIILTCLWIILILQIF